MFLTVVAFVLVVWVLATIVAHLADELLWWALPTKAKIAIKTIQWNVEVLGAQLAVWEYNFHNRISRRWTNRITLWIRANAETAMRKQIQHAENRLETLSLLLNGIEQ